MPRGAGHQRIDQLLRVLMGIERIPGRPGDARGKRRAVRARLLAVEQLHRQAGGAPLGDQALEQRPLPLVEEIDHAAAGPELEAVEFRRQAVREPAARQPQLHLQAGPARVQPLIAGVATGSAPGRRLRLDQEHPLLAARQEIGRGGADDAPADDNDVDAIAHARPPGPSNQSFRWKEARVSMQSRFQERYSSTPAMPSSRPRPERCRPPKDVSTWRI